MLICRLKLKRETDTPTAPCTHPHPAPYHACVAICSKDFAYLLKSYGESFWWLYKPEFMEHMPVVRV